MSAGRYNILIEQGSDYATDLTLQDTTGAALNITDITITSQARLKATDALPLIDFTITKTDPELGKFRMSLIAAQTAALNFDVAVYDVQLSTDSGSVTRLIQGNVVLSKTVTR